VDADALGGGDRAFGARPRRDDRYVTLDAARRRCEDVAMAERPLQPEEVAAAYFDAWQRKDSERVRPLLHHDVDFSGALGATHGLDETLAGLGGMFAMSTRVEVVHRWIDGPDVLTWFELRTATAGPMAIVNWSHVEDGRITRIRVTFDPRPLLV
jgi:hypothetical protein